MELRTMQRRVDPRLPKIENVTQGAEKKLKPATYKLTGSAEKFTVPATTSLRSNLEQQRGRLDSWPVHSLLPAPSNLTLGKPGLMPGQPTHKFPERDAIIPKPKYLQQLEDHLQRELRFLSCPPCGPDKMRLQAYREVFEFLVADFRTYRPLLSAIKNEYEIFLEHQDETIRELMPLRTQLLAAQDEFEKRVRAIKAEEKKEDEEMQQERKGLLTKLHKMSEEEKSYKAQVKRLQDELGKVYEQYRNEADARKLLISDYNDLKARQQEQQTEEETQEKEDPTILKLKLARAREDLRAANLRINQMLADYGDVVPRREFDMIETSFRNLEAESETLKSQHSLLMEEHNTLLGVHKTVQAEREQFLEQLTRVKRTATPRPDWSRCADYVEGGGERWSELSKGLSSEELMEVLLAELAGVDPSEITRDIVFQGKGLGSDVPRYLRWEGEVVNTKMNHQTLEETIAGFWEYLVSKLVNKTTIAQSMDEILFEFLLLQNESIERAAIEAGYNMQDAWSRCSHDLYIQVFIKVLKGEVHSEAINNWVSSQVALTEALKKASSAKNMLPEDALVGAIHLIFPGKPQEHIDELIQCAKKIASVSDTNTIDIIKLMSKAINKQPSMFVKKLLEQSSIEAKQFVTDLSNALAEQKLEVTLAEVEAVLHQIDQNRPPVKIADVVKKIFGSEATKEATVTVLELLRTVEAYHIVRFGSLAS